MDLVLALLAGLGILRGANGVVHRFEREASADLASRLDGPQKRVQIRSSVGPEAIFGDVHGIRIEASRFRTERLPLVVEPKRSHAGRLETLELHLTDFNLRALHVERLDAAIPDCRFDLAAAVSHHTFHLTGSGTGEVSAEITQDDLADFIRHKFPALEGLRATIDRDKVVLEGRGVILFSPSNFWIAGSLEIDGGTRLRLVHTRMILNGRALEPANAARLADLFNPVLDLDRDLGLGGAVRAGRLELRDGRLSAFGTVEIPPETAVSAPAL